MRRTHRRQDVSDEVLQRIEEINGLLEAIEGGELFAAAPARPDDRARHQTGVTLLALLRRLRRVTRDFTPPEGAGLAWHELWRGFEALEVSLHEHVRLVNSVLFLCSVVDESARPAAQVERVQ